ncbi:MAG: hypothetical protein ACREXK_11575 [Gammaproteobacteria bacterium]
MPLSAPALQALPAYLEASGNEKRILECLTRDYFDALLTKARAFAPLTRSARLGAATAKKLGAHRDALRFTLFSNIFQGLATFRTNHAEIEALMAMDVYPAAIAAASRATLPEDRLHLTSIKHHRDSGVPKPWDEEYRRCWIQNVSDHSPPDTEIVLFGVAPGGESPIHDRWVLSGEKGLRLGTSINSLGMKLSEISILSSEEAIVRLQEVEAYTRGRLREHLGRRVEYSIFNLY